MFNFPKPFKISNTRMKMFESLVLTKVLVKHCRIFLCVVNDIEKYFSMDKRLKLLTSFTSLFKKEKNDICMSFML